MSRGTKGSQKGVTYGSGALTSLCNVVTKSKWKRLVEGQLESDLDSLCPKGPDPGTGFALLGQTPSEIRKMFAEKSFIPANPAVFIRAIALYKKNVYIVYVKSLRFFQTLLIFVAGWIFHEWRANEHRPLEDRSSGLRWDETIEPNFIVFAGSETFLERCQVSSIIDTRVATLLTVGFHYDQLISSYRWWRKGLSLFCKSGWAIELNFIVPSSPEKVINSGVVTLLEVSF